MANRRSSVLQRKKVLAMIFDKDKNTICALSTASGRAGIAVIRVSGPLAWSTVKQICSPLPSLIESHRAYFTKIFDKNAVVDEVLLTFFSEGKSFTGEETVEISCHGSPYLTQKIVNMLISLDCRHAEPGEFTYRAFMNGRIDLIQAESVLNLIDSQSQRSANLAQRQLQGELSGEIHFIIEELLTIGAHLEAQIDFSEEDILPSESDILKTRLQNVMSKTENLISTYGRGRLIKDGVNVVLLGEPNVGKSSLLNSLLAEDKAIVTNIAGTTRDVVTGGKLINGVVVNFYDTAGLRDTNDPIEEIGISKSKKTIGHADIIFLIVEASLPRFFDPSFFSDFLKNKEVVVVFNKIDLVESDTIIDLAQSEFLDLIRNELESQDISGVCISALTGHGVDELTGIIEKFIGQDFSENSVSVVSSRQYELLLESFKGMDAALKLLENSESPEFTVFEVKNAVISLHRMVGKVYDDQIMDRVFSEFCLGK